MTHEELRPLLPAYAAGVLDEVGSNAVRAHLAGGCLACLHEVFARPVGRRRPQTPEPALPVVEAPAHVPPLVAISEPPPPLVRTPEPVVGAPDRVATPGQTPLPVEPGPPVAHAAAPRHLGLVVAIVVLALALGAAVTWIVVELRGREAAYRAEATGLESRLVETQAARAALAARAEALQRELEEARAEAARQAAAVHEMTEASAKLRDELANLRQEFEAARERVEALGRELRSRERDLEAVRLGAHEEDVVRQLLASTDTELLHLKAVAPFRDASGQALWSPSRRRGVVYAFGLPSLPAASTYRLRLGFDDGQQVAGPPFRVDGRGAATVVINAPMASARVRDLEVILDPPNRPVAAWRRPAPNGRD